MAGIKDIAEKAGVSIATVSNVLNGKHNMSEETRKKILDIADELDYQASRESAKSKKTTTRTLAVIFSDFDRSFYRNVLHGISDYAYSKDYDIMIVSSRNAEKYMDPEYSLGCINLDYRCEDTMLMDIADKGYPIIVLDRDLGNTNIKSIIVNNYNAEKEMIESLIDAGYAHFAFLSGLDTDDNRERYQAFRDALSGKGVAFHRRDFYEGDWREKSGEQAARLLLLSEHMPEVLVCANDRMAVGAIRKFKESGLRVPEDIAVCGFDDTFLARYIGLTTVEVPDYERGFLAAQSLVELIEGKGNYEPLKIGARIKWRNTAKKSEK